MTRTSSRGIPARPFLHSIAAFLAFACGPKPEPVEPAPAVVHDEPPPPDGLAAGQQEDMEIVRLTGSLSPQEVSNVMTMKAIPAFNLCLQFYLPEREFVFGKAKIGFDVDPTGKTTSSKLIESTYGDRELEKCFLGKAKLVKFPKPHGGGTSVEYEFSTDVIPGVETPIVMSAQKLEAALEPFEPEIDQCLAGTTGWSVTFYVGGSLTEEIEDEDGEPVTVTTSRVLALGGTGPDGGLEPLDCLLEASAGWKLPIDVDGVQKAKLSF